MRKLSCIVTLALLAAAPTAAGAATADLLGTWKGEGQSIAEGVGAHHPDNGTGKLRLATVPFTLVIDNQDGNRFSGTFSSSQHSETVIAIVSRDGTIFMADDDGHTTGTMLAPDLMEICYVHSSPENRVASCTETTRQQ